MFITEVNRFFINIQSLNNSFLDIINYITMLHILCTRFFSSYLSQSKIFRMKVGLKSKKKKAGGGKLSLGALMKVKIKIINSKL